MAHNHQTVLMVAVSLPALPWKGSDVTRVIGLVVVDSPAPRLPLTELVPFTPSVQLGALSVTVIVACL